MSFKQFIDKNEVYQKFRDTFEKLMPHQGDNLDQWFGNTIKWTPIKNQQAANWIFYLEIMTNNILTNKAQPSDYAMFWIRLYGVITELRAQYSKYAEQQINDKMSADVKKRISIVGSIAKLSEEIKNTFTEGELILIHNSRHSMAHIWQDSYRIIPKLSKGKLAFKRISRVYDKEWEITELNKQVEAELIKYSGNENAAAKAYAGKIKDKIKQIADLMTSLDPSR